GWRDGHVSIGRGADAFRAVSSGILELLGQYGLLELESITALSEGPRKHRDDRCPGFELKQSERRRGGGRPPEEGNENGLLLDDVLIHQNRHRLILTNGSQDLFGGVPLRDDAISESSPPPGELRLQQGIVERANDGKDGLGDE